VAIFRGYGGSRVTHYFTPTENRRLIGATNGVPFEIKRIGGEWTLADPALLADHDIVGVVGPRERESALIAQLAALTLPTRDNGDEREILTAEQLLGAYAQGRRDLGP
jgi:hypothetical protein